MSGREAIILTRPEEIAMASWLALRGALRLEMLGMIRNGPSANSIACRRLGLPKSTRRHKTLAALDEHINNLKAPRI